MRNFPPIRAGVVPRVRFRVSSIEPRDVDDDLIELMAASNGPHLPPFAFAAAIGFEQGAARNATPLAPSDFWAWSKLYAAMPQLSLSTDVISGFPWRN